MSELLGWREYYRCILKSRVHKGKEAASDLNLKSEQNLYVQRAVSRYDLGGGCGRYLFILYEKLQRPRDAKVGRRLPRGTAIIYQK